MLARITYPATTTRSPIGHSKTTVSWPTRLAMKNEAAPSAMLIGTHMEAVNHCVLTRSALRAFAEQQGFSDNLRLPADGETIAV